jgi:DNA-binding response OmpR family regulator
VDVHGRVLLVEDDASLQETQSLALRRAGFDVVVEGDGAAGLARARRQAFRLLLLDVLLPRLDGLSICREVRRESRVPIILLTAKDEPKAIVQGLEAGADDYVVKPFDLSELVARMRSVLRRVSPDIVDVMRVGRLEIDVRRKEVAKDGFPVTLSPTELRLLVEFATLAPRVVTREHLIRRVWGYAYLGDSRLVDMAVKRLRDKIEDHPAEPTGTSSRTRWSTLPRRSRSPAARATTWSPCRWPTAGAVSSPSTSPTRSSRSTRWRRRGRTGAVVSASRSPTSRRGSSAGGSRRAPPSARAACSG